MGLRSARLPEQFVPFREEFTTRLVPRVVCNDDARASDCLQAAREEARLPSGFCGDMGATGCGWSL
jgi:hypothetical protein